MIKAKSKKPVYEPLWRLAIWGPRNDYPPTYESKFLAEKTWDIDQTQLKEINRYNFFYQMRKAYYMKKRDMNVAEISKKMKVSTNYVRKLLKESKKYSESQISKFPRMDQNLGIITYGILGIVIIYFGIYLIAYLTGW